MWGNISLRRFHVNLFVGCFPSNCHTYLILRVFIVVVAFPDKQDWVFEILPMGNALYSGS